MSRFGLASVPRDLHLTAGGAPAIPWRAYIALNPPPPLGTSAGAAERGGSPAAARALGLTQSAVSQRIQQLEQCVGRALSPRAAGRGALTEAGRRLFEYARRIV